MSDKPELQEINEDDPRYEQCREWPTRTKAAREFGCSTRSLEFWWERGDVEKVLVDGVQRFNPDDIKAKQRERVAEGASAEANDAALLTTASSDVIAELTRALRMSREHEERMFGKFESLYRLLIESQGKQNDQLLRRLETLEKTHADAIEAREQALSDLAERNALERQQIQSERRKDALVSFMLSQLGPHIVSRLGGNVPEVKLAQSFTRQQLEILIESGVLEDEQTTQLKAYMAKRWPESKEGEDNVYSESKESADSQ